MLDVRGFGRNKLEGVFRKKLGCMGNLS